MSDALDDLDEADGEGSVTSSSGSGKAVILGIVGIAVGIGLGMFVFSRSSSEADAATPQGQQGAEGAPQDSLGPTVELEGFIVNLVTRRGEAMHYLKTKIVIELSSDSWLENFEKRKVRVRHAMLLYMSSLTVAETQSIENKHKLQAALEERVAEIVGAQAVKQIYLTEFVVQ